MLAQVSVPLLIQSAGMGVQASVFCAVSASQFWRVLRAAAPLGTGKHALHSSARDSGFVAAISGLHPCCCLHQTSTLPP